MTLCLRFLEGGVCQNCRVNEICVETLEGRTRCVPLNEACEYRGNPSGTQLCYNWSAEMYHCTETEQDCCPTQECNVTCNITADCGQCQECIDNLCQGLCGIDERCCTNECKVGNCCNDADCSGDLICLNNQCSTPPDDDYLCSDPLTLSHVADVVRYCRQYPEACDYTKWYAQKSFDFTDTDYNLVVSGYYNITTCDATDIIINDGAGTSCFSMDNCHDSCLPVAHVVNRLTLEVDGSSEIFEIMCPSSDGFTTPCSGGSCKVMDSLQSSNIDWQNSLITCDYLKTLQNQTLSSGQYEGCSYSDSWATADRPCAVRLYNTNK